MNIFLKSLAGFALFSAFVCLLGDAPLAAVLCVTNALSLFFASETDRIVRS